MGSSTLYVCTEDVTHTHKKKDNSREKSKRGDMLTAAPSPPQMQL